MNSRLYELIKARQGKEITYKPDEKNLEIKIEDDNIKIRFHNEKSCCVFITVKMITKQNANIYNTIKNELIELHKPFSESAEFVEVEADDKDVYSFFGISVKKDEEDEEMQKVEKEYMYQMLKTVIDSEGLYKDVLNAIEEDKNIYIIRHKKGAEIFGL